MSKPRGGCLTCLYCNRTPKADAWLRKWEPQRRSGARIFSIASFRREFIRRFPGYLTFVRSVNSFSDHVTGCIRA